MRHKKGRDGYEKKSPNDSDLRAAIVDRELAARLAFENPALQKSLTTLETTLRLFVENFGAPTQEFQIQGEDLNDDRVVAQHKLAIIRHLLGTRLGAHLTEIVESVSNQRTLSVAQSVRAVLETAGAATYYEAKFRKSAAEIPALLKQIDRALYGQRFEWNVWQGAIGKEPREELETFLRSEREGRSHINQFSPPSVMTFIDALEESLLQKLTEPAKRDGKPTPMQGHVRAIYSQLCDFVHPSIGTWKTYAHTEPEAFKVVISSCSRLQSLQFLWFVIGECAAAMSLLGFQALQGMESLRTSICR
ncbi:MAG: hypothetical protein ACSLFB_09555 [Acidimicrobiales bacterium]